MPSSDCESTDVEYVSNSRASRMRTTILGLPDELLGVILTYLSFWQVVNVSQTCSRLRAVALAHSKLWQNLPSAPSFRGVQKLRTLVPFLGRTGELGCDLEISFIEISELAYVCSILDDHFAQFRKLHLDIEEPPCCTPLDTNAVALLQETLSAPAPLLEDLCIAGSGKEAFLGTMRPDVLGGLAPNLRKLYLTVFSLDSVCPGLQTATSVVISVGALAPKQKPEENQRLHELFPAIKDLELMGIDIQDGNDDSEDWPRPLARVPIIDSPLESLKMSWYPEGEVREGEDAGAAAWLRESVKHVRHVMIETAQRELVSEAVFSPFLEKAQCLRIQNGMPDELGPCLDIALSDPQTLRSALMRVEEAHALLGRFLLRAKHLNLYSLVLSTDTLSLDLVKDVQGALSQLSQLRVVVVDIRWPSIRRDGAFIAPEMLASLQPLNNVAAVHFCAPLPSQSYRINLRSRMIEGLLILLFMMKVFPNARVGILNIALNRVRNHALLFNLGFRYLPVSP